MKIHLLTQNSFKVQTAQLAVKPFGIEVEPLSLDIPEIQADTNLEIARHSAVVAAKQLGHPVAREDHGFFLEAFPGWPGPYMAHAERIFPAADVLRLLEGKSRQAHFCMALVYAYPNGKTLEYEYELPCDITPCLRQGETDFGWDTIIALAGDDRALSEYPMQDRLAPFTQNYEKLGRFLQEHSVREEVLTKA